MSYLVMALRGRLGANLFQYASGLGMARAIGAELLFDEHHLQDPVSLLPELLGRGYREASRAHLWGVGIASFSPRTGPTAARALLRRANTLGRATRGKPPAQMILYDGKDGFRPELMALRSPVYLGGWFQDERFFAAVADEVAASLRFPAGAPGLPDLGPTVAVSFRRGDYNAFEAVLPIDWYDRAMQLVRDEVDDPTFVLFGDDPGFVELFAERARRQNFRVFSALDLGTDPISQLRWLSECDHAVVPDSAFAWWGAWLGDRRGAAGRVVVAPSEWSHHKVRDGWRGLDTVEGVVTERQLEVPRRSAAASG